jgi:DNA-binding protein H-NS
MQGGPSPPIVIDLARLLYKSGSVRLSDLCYSLQGCHASMKNTEHRIVDLEDDAERIAAIRKIRKLMDFWRITPTELRGRPLSLVRPQASAEIRYRHPVTAEVWDGLGTQPQWLRDALIKEGYTVEELRRTVSQQRPVAESPSER